MSCCGKKLVQKASHIVKGNAMYAAYSVGFLPKEKYEYWRKRRDICKNCEYNKWILNKLFCSICKCFIPAKAMVKDEKCPKGFWKGIDNE